MSLYSDYMKRNSEPHALPLRNYNWLQAQKHIAETKDAIRKYIPQLETILDKEQRISQLIEDLESMLNVEPLLHEYFYKKYVLSTGVFSWTMGGYVSVVDWLDALLEEDGENAKYRALST